MNVLLSTSSQSNKKFMVIITFTNENKKCIIHFGAKGYEDYTIHKDDMRKERYIKRHSKRENWSKSGICSAGFWSRWLLWNKKTIQSSINDIKNKFDISIRRKT